MFFKDTGDVGMLPHINTNVTLNIECKSKVNKTNKKVLNSTKGPTLWNNILI